MMKNRLEFCVGEADAKFALQGLYLKNNNFLEFLEFFIFVWGTHRWSPDQTLHFILFYFI